MYPRSQRQKRRNNKTHRRNSYRRKGGGFFDHKIVKLANQLTKTATEVNTGLDNNSLAVRYDDLGALNEALVAINLVTQKFTKLVQGFEALKIQKK